MWIATRGSLERSLSGERERLFGARSVVALARSDCERPEEALVLGTENHVLSEKRRDRCLKGGVLSGGGGKLLVRCAADSEDRGQSASEDRDASSEVSHLPPNSDSVVSGYWDASNT